jgi:hypothetical protein
VLCAIVVQVLQKTFCDLKLIEFYLYKLERKVKVNKLRLATKNEQGVVVKMKNYLLLITIVVQAPIGEVDSFKVCSFIAIMQYINHVSLATLV